MRGVRCHRRGKVKKRVESPRLELYDALPSSDGRFDIPGVPPGNGYVASANAETMALEEQFGIDVRPQGKRLIHPAASVKEAIPEPLPKNSVFSWLSGGSGQNWM